MRAVMTPRHEVDMIDLSDAADDVRRTILRSMHSRLPVHEGDPESMLGVVQAKDLLDAYIRGEVPDVRALVRQAPTVPDTADALVVLDTIKISTVHLALVHDEYGHFEGVVTNADILEAIAGTFSTDEGAVEPDAVQRDDGSWLIAGSMAINDMVDRLGLPKPDHPAFHTAAGFVLNELGYLPALGESFEVHGWRFEVIDLDGRRIDKILASKLPVSGRRPRYGDR